MNPKIIGFDENTCQVILYVEGFPPFAVDIPIDEKGMILEGQPLKQFLSGFYPSQHFERKRLIAQGIKNIDQIKNLVEPLPETPVSIEQLANQEREIRNQMLQMSDWTQLPDAPLSEQEKQVWADYRQQLRDLTKQINFPTNVTYPISPAQEPR